MGLHKKLSRDTAAGQHPLEAGGARSPIAARRIAGFSRCTGPQRSLRFAPVDPVLLYPDRFPSEIRIDDTGRLALARALLVQRSGCLISRKDGPARGGPAMVSAKRLDLAL
jgi:hypothetical protein